MNRTAPEQTNYRRLDEAEAFTMVSNAAWKDKTLSLEAKGLLISLVTLPKDWLFNRTWAMREFNVGRDKLDRIVGELRDSGYIVYVRPRDAAGKLQAGYYLYAANPESLGKAKSSLESGNHSPENPPAGKTHPVANPAAGSSSRRENRGAYVKKDSYKKRKRTKERASARSASGASENLSPEEEPPAATPCPPSDPEPAYISGERGWKRLEMSANPHGKGWLPNWGPPPRAAKCTTPPDVIQRYERKFGPWRERGGYGVGAKTTETKRADWQQASSAIN